MMKKVSDMGLTTVTYHQEEIDRAVAGSRTVSERVDAELCRQFKRWGGSVSRPGGLVDYLGGGNGGGGK